MRTESDISQDVETPSSARPLLAGTSSAALAAAPGSVHVSPKGSVIGFMPVPASQHPLHGEEDTMVGCSVPGLLASSLTHLAHTVIVTVTAALTWFVQKIKALCLVHHKTADLADTC